MLAYLLFMPNTFNIPECIIRYGLTISNFCLDWEKLVPQKSNRISNQLGSDSPKNLLCCRYLEITYWLIMC